MAGYCRQRSDLPGSKQAALVADRNIGEHSVQRLTVGYFEIEDGWETQAAFREASSAVAMISWRQQDLLFSLPLSTTVSSVHKSGQGKQRSHRCPFSHSRRSVT
ncbi:MAG: hypothetical protein ACJAVZ_001020 [Afipia broomeae]|jgi:hypothetical protein